MDRKMFEPTAKQVEKWSMFKPTLQTDEEYKARGKKERKPWGILKRNDVLRNMTMSAEYQRGLWQGRVDKARGLDYCEERNENTYNLGYYRGYTEFNADLNDRQGWDKATFEWFWQTYGLEA